MKQRAAIHVVLIATLLAINFYYCLELFRFEYIDQLASIEAAYISLANYISRHWRDLDWFPLWYGGIPFQNTYPPLLHLTSAAVVTLFGLPPGRAYHAVCGVFFCLGPAALYWLVLRLARSTRTAFFAGLFY